MGTSGILWYWDTRNPCSIEFVHHSHLRETCLQCNDYLLKTNCGLNQLDAFPFTFAPESRVYTMVGSTWFVALYDLSTLLRVVSIHQISLWSHCTGEPKSVKGFLHYTGCRTTTDAPSLAPWLRSTRTWATCCCWQRLPVLFSPCASTVLLLPAPAL